MEVSIHVRWDGSTTLKPRESARREGLLNCTRGRQSGAKRRVAREREREGERGAPKLHPRQADVAGEVEGGAW